MEFLGRGQQPLSHQLESLGERCELLGGDRAEPRPPKGFPLFSALRMMASPDTIISLNAAIGGKTPVPPCVRPWYNQEVCLK